MTASLCTPLSDHRQPVHTTFQMTRNDQPVKYSSLNWCGESRPALRSPASPEPPGASTRADPPMLGAEFFSQYDGLIQQELSLTGVETRLKNSQDTLSQLRKEDKEAEIKHADLTSKIQERKDRIQKCQSSWIMGSTLFNPQLWVRGGVQGKIDRQKAKLAADELTVQDVAQQKQQLEQKITQEEQQVSQLSSSNAQKQGIINKREQMFNDAVASRATPAYQQLMFSFQQQQQMEAAHDETVRGMEGVVKLCEEAVTSYKKAVGDMNAAAREDANAQRPERMDLQREQDRKQRDRMANFAQQHASAGEAKLNQALGSIPAAARTQHPQLCNGFGMAQSGGAGGVAQLGAMTSVMQQGFGGGSRGLLGAAMGVGMGMSLQNNVRQLSQAEAHTSAQLGQAQALLNACKQQQSAASFATKQMEAQLVAEKNRIFAEMREAAGADAVTAFGTPVALGVTGGADLPTPPPAATPPPAGTAPTAATPPPAAPPKAGSFCSHCGTQLPASSKFCSSCGAQVAAAQ